MSPKKQKSQNKIIEKVKNEPVPFLMKKWQLIIVLVVLVVYGQIIKFDFINLDDTKIILDNFDKISSLSDIPTAFINQYGFDQGSPYYRPIILTSFVIDAQFSKREPIFYHIANLLYHLISVIILFYLLMRLIDNFQIAYLLSVIFAIHPVLTNAVVWIAGRNDVLVGLFSLLSLLYFIKYIKKDDISNLIIHIFFFLMAILSKEVALILPILFLVYFYLFNKEKYNVSLIYKLGLPWIVLIAVFQLVKSNIIKEVENLTYGLPAIIKNVNVIPEVIFKVFWPINISVLPTSNQHSTIIGSIILILLLSLPFIITRLDKKKYYFGLFWFFLFLIPGLSVYYSDQENRFNYLDSRLYLPIIGLILMCAEVLRVYEFNFIKSPKKVLTLAIILFFAILTFFQSKKYENAVTFAESAVLSNPNKPFFYHKLADHYFQTKEYPKAIENISISLKLDPDNMMYRKNLILAYANLKQYDNAIRSINDALIIKPNDPELIRGLMLMYYQKKDKINTLKYADLLVSLGGKVEEKFYNSLKE